MTRNKLGYVIQWVAFLGASLSMCSFAEEQEKKSTDNEKVIREVLEVEEVIVTGSRIVRDNNLLQPNPVINMDASELQDLAAFDLGQALAELPAVSGSSSLIGRNGSNSGAGMSSSNLRYLGTQRTLVLVDGYRHVAGAPGQSTVDLGTIPQPLIQNVEVITGGASAVYGSDAVSGVINVITKKDFEGTTITADGQLSDRVDTLGTVNFTIVSGKNLNDGQGNIVVHGTYNSINEVMVNDLQIPEDNWGSVLNYTVDNADDEDNGIPDYIFVPRVYSAYMSPTGVVNSSNPDDRWTFMEDGTPVEQVTRAGNNAGIFGYFPDGCDYCLKNQDYRNYSPELERMNIGTLFNYSLSDATHVYTDIKYVTSTVAQQFQPSFRFGNATIDVENNAYMDEGLRQHFLDQEVTTLGIAKVLNEFGNRSADNERSTLRLLGGVKGKFEWAGTDFTYDVFYNYGRTNNVRVSENDMIEGNFAAAIDAVVDPATDDITCRGQVASLQGDDYENPATVDVDNCLPYNIFGFGQASQAAIDWVSADVTREDTITQRNFGGFVSFDSSEYFSLPGGAMKFALGAEYRKESSETVTDELTQSGVMANAATPDESGSFSVKEGFVEASLPILSGVLMAKDLSLELAYRYSDYDAFGSVDSSKIALMYAPIDSLSFRGSWGTAMRAPNLTEAFSPQTPLFSNVADPCDASRLDEDEDRAANCAALGLPSDFVANDNVSVDIISGGNPNLTPETSESYTAGFIFTPDIFNDFSLTLDYYNIDIEDAILQVGATNVVVNCVDGANGLDQDFCSRVDRNPETNDIELVRTNYVNAANYSTSGMELNLKAGFVVGSGSLSTNVQINRLITLKYNQFQNLPEEIDFDHGQIGSPKYQARLRTSYAWSDFRVSWAARFIDRSAGYDVTPEPFDESTPEDVAIPYLGSITTHDLSASYTLGDQYTFNIGVRNVFNKTTLPYSLNTIYDALGRRMNLGVSMNF